LHRNGSIDASDGMSDNDGGDATADRRELAEDRTNFAEDRTVMALERTFAGWMRTSFAALGIGIAFHALFGELQPPWLARAIATLFVILGAAIAMGAARRASHSFERLSPHKINGPAVPRLRWVAYAVVTASLLLAASFWLIDDGA
jgi:putative membrane protein